MPEGPHLRCIVIDPQARTIVEDQCPTKPNDDGKSDAEYDWLKARLGGGWLETTPRYFGGKQSIVIIDEEGRLKNLQPFVITTDQGPEDLCGIGMLFGPVKNSGAIGGLSPKISLDDIKARVAWLPMGTPAPDGGFRIIMEPEMEYLCKITVDSKFHVAVWNGTMFQIDPAMIDPRDRTRFNPGPVSYFTLEPKDVGLTAKGMDPVFHPKVFSPARWHNARSYMEKVKAVVAAQINMKPSQLIEVPMCAGVPPTPVGTDDESEEE